ncbi:MAG: hypothetical protein ACK5N9_20605, partial [Pirellula sp.]
FLWSTIIDANSLDSRPFVDDLPCDAASVRRRSAVIAFGVDVHPVGTIARASQSSFAATR